MCTKGFKVQTDLKFRIQRDMSWHNTKVIYLREGATHPELFQFAHPPPAPLTVLTFDGTNIMCSGNPRTIGCNNMAFGVQFPAIILSVDIQPREGAILAADGDWQRNRFDLSGSHYELGCAGENGACKTMAGDSCVFPFKYYKHRKTYTFNKCTDMDYPGGQWCATKLDGGYVTGHNWGSCNMNTGCKDL
jgi:hypothetical protein